MLTAGDQSKVVRVAAYVDQENAVMANAQGGAPLPANVVDAAGMVTFHIVTFDRGGGVPPR